MSDTEDEGVAALSANPRKPQIQRRSLHHEVLERLRDMVVEGELPPGARIAEGELCEQFGISRTPMREALKVLASEGLVELLPSRGARVAVITPEEIDELFEAVSGIERIAAELATERMTDRDLDELRELQRRMQRHFQLGQRHEYFRLNQEAHNAIVALAGNSVLSAIHASLMIRVRRARYLAILSRQRWEESVAEHDRILDAFAARDMNRAGRLIMKHVRATGEVVKQSFDSTLDTAGKPPLYAAE